MDTIKLKWIIAHEPAYLFHRVAADFKKIVNENSGTDVKIDIEILSADEYNASCDSKVKASRHNLWELLKSNDVQIAQMQTTSLAKQFNKDMHVLDLPYLFDDHDHAAQVLEGEIGTHLLNSFEKQSKIKGLAFTYSGGFRLMPFSENVSSLGDLVGSHIRSGMSSIAQETIKSFGFTPVPTEIDETSKVVLSGKAKGAEHVAQRLLPDQCDDWIKTIIDTEHSLFLTSIIVNVDWWNSLPTKVQNIFSYAATQAARNERALSIADGQQSIEKLTSNGVKLVRLSKDEKDQLKEKTSVVYSKYGKMFSSDFVSKIKRK